MFSWASYPKEAECLIALITGSHIILQNCQTAILAICCVKKVFPRITTSDTAHLLSIVHLLPMSNTWGGLYQHDYSST